jgi:hypothetical protein
VTTVDKPGFDLRLNVREPRGRSIESALREAVTTGRLPGTRSPAGDW